MADNGRDRVPRLSKETIATLRKIQAISVESATHLADLTSSLQEISDEDFYRISNKAVEGLFNLDWYIHGILRRVGRGD